jgi:aromatic ring-cleaving dioxygenase
MMKIQAFHAHVYFDLSQTVMATKVRETIIAAIPTLTYMGELIPMPIGPHPKPMFELHVPAANIEASTAKINALRQGLSVLIHPVQHDEIAAHTADAIWLGEPLKLNIEILKAILKRRT